MKPTPAAQMHPSTDRVKAITIVSITLLLVRSLVAQVTPSTKAEHPAKTDSRARTVSQAEVHAVHGAARYSTNGNVWHALRVGTKLPPGTVVQTATDSTIELFLGKDMGTIRMNPDSVVRLERMVTIKNGSKADYEIGLDLRTGSIAFQVNEILGAESKYEIKFPNGVAGVRKSGKFRLDAEGKASAETGSLVVARTAPDGTTQTQAITGR